MGEEVGTYAQNKPFSQGRCMHFYRGKSFYVLCGLLALALFCHKCLNIDCHI